MPFGKLILFGSGETSPSGKKIQRKILSRFGKKQRIAILETPAGFQPNATQVATEIADIFKNSVAEFVDSVSLIPAWKKGLKESPDNEEILKPLLSSNYIFLGPGSPTYTVKQLQDSKALGYIENLWQNGASLCLSSAAAIAVGEYVLPVYEIFKVGSDLYWEKGLNLFQQAGFHFSVIPHWNNAEGKDWDSRFCFMGEKRFDELYTLLPKDTTMLGIDENTAIIFDFQNKLFSIEGFGSVTLISGEKRVQFLTGKSYDFSSLKTFAVKEVAAPEPVEMAKEEKEVSFDELSDELKGLLEERETARKNGDFKKSDEVRAIFEEKGFTIQDTKKGQKVFVYRG